MMSIRLTGRRGPGALTAAAALANVFLHAVVYPLPPAAADYIYSFSKHNVQVFAMFLSCLVVFALASVLAAKGSACLICVGGIPA